MTEMVTPRSQQWRVLLPVGVAMVLSLSGDLTLYAVLPVYAPTIGLGLSAVGVILSANRLIRLLGNPAAGLLFDRWGRRRLFLLGLGLGTLSTASYVVAEQFWLFLLGRLLWGVSWSLINVGAYAMVADITSEKDRGWGSGVLQTFYFVGLGVNPLLGGLLTDWLNFQFALVACAALTGVGFMIARVALPETMPPRVHSPKRRQLWKGVSLQRLRQAIRGLAGFRAILAADYLALLTDFVGDGIIMSTISLYLARRYGEAISFNGLALRVASVGGALLAIRALVSAGVAPLAGRLFDRAHNRWVVASWGVVIGAVGMLLLVVENGLWLLVMGLVLVALSGGVLRTILPALLGDLASAERRGTAMGGLATAGDLGSALAPLLTYALLAVISLKAIYLVSAFSMATGLAASWLMARDGEVVAH